MLNFRKGKKKQEAHSHAILSVNVTDTNSVEQTTNTFWTYAKFDQKDFDDELVERIEADCFRD